MSYNYIWNRDPAVVERDVRMIAQLPESRYIDYILPALRGPDADEPGARLVKYLTTSPIRFWVRRCIAGEVATPKQARRMWGKTLPYYKDEARRFWQSPEQEHFRGHIRSAFEVLGNLGPDYREYVLWVERVLSAPATQGGGQ